LELRTQDNVGGATIHANFGENGSMGLLPKYVKYKTFVIFDRLVLLVFSAICIGQTIGSIFALYGSNDVFLRVECLFGG